MKRSHALILFIAGGVAPVSVPGCAHAAAADAADALFVRRIWPLFEEKCLACHGKDETKIKGGFDMRTQASTLKGGDSEKAAIVAGRPGESPLYLAIERTHDDEWDPMPPKDNDKLTAEQTAWVKDWIIGGAPWLDEAARTKIAQSYADKWSAEDGITVQTTGALSAEWANRRYKPDALWAYQPVRKPAMKEEGSNAIDQLLAMHLPAGAKAAPAADARTFIRRATYDLLGLPPTPVEMADFEVAYGRDADRAVRDLVDRLLASPHYGEQWARHWLDVVRYADSSGFANDYERGNAWRYRDYVVRSFNDDKPYARFIEEQIAGDELRPGDPEALIATGYLRMGPWELTGMEVAKVARQRFLDDVTNSVGETFLAQSLQCARCHDHKFDPVPTHDYYAIQACFATTQLSERAAPFLPTENLGGFEERHYLEQLKAQHESVLRELDTKSLQAVDGWFVQHKVDRAAWDRAVAELKANPRSGKGRSRLLFTLYDAARNKLAMQGVPEDQYPPKQLGFNTNDFGAERVARKGLERLQWELDRYEPYAFGVYDGKTPDVKSINAPVRLPKDRNAGELEQTAILAGGDPFSPTKPVQPDVLSVIAAFNPGTASLVRDGMEGRRADLAGWVANPNNPLTTRAIANRLWLWHFGKAIAGNPNNFGSTGKRPTHPELLDWLAATLVEKGWSIKAMHRLIMNSAAYRRSAEAPPGEPEGVTREDLEKSYAVFTPRRLTAEEMRDTMLSLTGELNPLLGGIPNRPEINIEVAMQPRQVMGTFAAAWVPNPLPLQRHRRSLYALKIRGLRDPFMEVFNEPAPDFSCEARDVSTVTPQAFSLFNSQASAARALTLANRVLRENPPSVIDRLFELAYGRKPSAEERAACEAHWRRMTAKQESLQPAAHPPPLSVRREAVEENTGEKFSFEESLPGYADFVPDLQPGDVDARTRGLADVCLALLNSNEFVYVY